MILRERELVPELLASAEARHAGALIRSALSAGHRRMLAGAASG